MSQAVADVVGQHLAGQHKANLLLDRIANGTDHPDLLDAEVAQVVDQPGVRRGLLRTIQKALERSVA